MQGLTTFLETQTPSSKIENQIAALQSALSPQGSGQSYNASAYVPLGDGAPNTIAAASNIGSVSGSSITNLTPSEIPNLSGSYLARQSCSIDRLRASPNSTPVPRATLKISLQAGEYLMLRDPGKFRTT
jgi:hypothetical protein